VKLTWGHWESQKLKYTKVSTAQCEKKYSYRLLLKFHYLYFQIFKKILGTPTLDEYVLCTTLWCANLQSETSD